MVLQQPTDSRVARTSTGLTHFNVLVVGAPFTAKVITLRFLTDHHLMKDNTTNWKNEGSLYAKPEWTTGVDSAPISHTKNKVVEAEVEIEVTSTFARKVLCNIEGNADFGIKFIGEARLTGGKQKVKVK